VLHRNTSTSAAAYIAIAGIRHIVLTPESKIVLEKLLQAWLYAGNIIACWGKNTKNITTQNRENMLFLK
jgi:threonine synthase